MEPILGDRPNVNPPLIINQNTTFPSDTSDSTSTPLESQKDDASVGVSAAGEDALDPYLTGASHRAKKKRKTRDPNEGVNMMLEVFEKRWESDKEMDLLTREAEKEGREQLMDIMKKNQQTMSDAIDVLRYIADKM